MTWSDNAEQHEADLGPAADFAPQYDGYVIAEDAPIGVQLWPTVPHASGAAFKLRSVAVVRNEVHVWVVWTYESNTIRTFELGERVVVRVAAAHADKIQDAQPHQY